MSKRRKAFPRVGLLGIGEKASYCVKAKTPLLPMVASIPGEALGMLQRDRVLTRDPGSIICLEQLQFSSVGGGLSLLCHVAALRLIQ